VGQKFHDDKRVRYFPGNTFVCHIPKESLHYRFCCDFQEGLKKLPCASKYSFMPPESFHMTLFKGVCDEVRDMAHWSGLFPLDNRLTDISRSFLDLCAELPEHNPFRMKYWYLYGLKDYGWVIRLQPADEESDREIRNYRNTMSEIFKIRHPGHNNYIFHISMAYPIEYLTEEEQKAFEQYSEHIGADMKKLFGTLELPQMDFCVFHNMHSFYPLAGK